MKTIARNAMNEAAKEINKIMEKNIAFNSKVSDAELLKAIGAAAKEFTSTDFGTGKECFSEGVKDAFKAMGLKVPDPKKIEEKKQQKETAKNNKANKKDKTKKFTRSDAAMQCIRELCKKGATLQEIVDRTDAIYVENGGSSVPDAVNVNKYALNGLVAFGVLELVEKKYRFPKTAPAKK